MEDSADCIRRWQEQRDESAARALIDALYPLVARIVRRHATGQDSPEDLAQEVFARWFAKLDHYDPRQPLENWTARLALNVCRNRWRHQARRPELRWEDLDDAGRAAAEAAFHSETAVPDLPASDARALLLRLLETLPADDRLVLSLLHLEEKSLEEIACQLGWSRVRVKVRAFRARAKLRQALAALERGCSGMNP